MTSPTFDTPRKTSPRLRGMAIVALATFGCSTVRVPASGIAPEVPLRENAPEPQIELWVESGKHVTPHEAERAAAEARAALEQALARRRVGEGDQMLVVRAQGVTRTRSRRADQDLAVAGIVVGAVALVAIVVVAVIAGKGKGGGAPKVGPARVSGGAGPRIVRPARVAAGPSGRPPSAPHRVPAAASPGPRRAPAAASRGSDAVSVDADVQVAVDLPPEDLPAETLSEEAPYGDAAAAVAPQPAAVNVAELVLPPPPPLEVARRGFFAGDSTKLELTLVDRATGTPLWVKVVERDVDPRDAGAVGALLDQALDDPQGWIPANP